MQVAETKVDNLVLYGSAGIGIGSVGDANAERWAVEHDEQGRQQIFYTDSAEDWTAPFGYLPGRLDGAIVPWISKEPRYTPRVIGDAQRFQSTEALTADGLFLGDVDTHSLVDKDDNEGFVHVNTTSLTYGALAALG